MWTKMQNERVRGRVWKETGSPAVVALGQASPWRAWEHTPQSPHLPAPGPGPRGSARRTSGQRETQLHRLSSLLAGATHQPRGSSNLERDVSCRTCVSGISVMAGQSNKRLTPWNAEAAGPGTVLHQSTIPPCPCSSGALRPSPGRSALAYLWLNVPGIL